MPRKPKIRAEGSPQSQGDVVRAVIQRLESTPPALGGRWRAGMLAYWKRVLMEVEAEESHNQKEV